MYRVVALAMALVLLAFPAQTTWAASKKKPGVNEFG